MHEGMNMAANWSLSVIFVCENNGYGEFTAIEDVTAGSDITKRGEVFGIPSQMIDGMDVLVVYEAARDAVQRAHRGEGPSFLICNTYRFGGHHVGDKQDYKGLREAEEWLRKDPIPKFARMLIESGEASESDLKTIDAEVAEEIRKSVDFAKKAPEPGPDLLETYLYAE
jgi:pyruvate dehydrogenase E1 component alpha subunit